MKLKGKNAARLVVIAILLASVGATGFASPTPPNADLIESYRLITQTYYATVQPQQLLDGAHDALAALVKHDGKNVALPAFHAQPDARANIAAISQAIDRVASATHETTRLTTYVAIAGLAHGVGDRYTQFFSPDQLRAFNDSLDPQKISGIGALISPDELTKYIQAVYIVPESPAERAGMQSGDDIVSIGGTSTKNLKSEDAVKVLRGRAGSVVNLQVQRDGKTLAPLAISRANINPPTVVYKTLPDNIGYIQIDAFGLKTPDEFTTALNRLEQQHVRGYVLDLRNDGGGYVNSALDISAHFVNDAPLVTVEDRGSHLETYDAPHQAIASRPVTILVNRFTASASEIMAGALQDDGIGVLVGEKTFGKGVVQTLTNLPDGAGIKITTAHYLTPKKRDINLKGIEPDYPVALNKNAVFGTISRDAQLRTALDVLQKKIAALR